jgi:hypothetical protein
MAIWRRSDSLEVAYAPIFWGTSDPLIDGFRYVTLAAPVTLLQGTEYIIGAGFYVDGVEDFYLVSASVTMSGVTWHTGMVNSTAGDFAVPDEEVSSDLEQSVFGPNLLYEVVPEPSSAITLFVAGMGLLRRAVRSRRKGRSR